MQKFLRVMYNIRYLFYGGTVGSIPFLVMISTGIATPKNNIMFYWAAICVTGVILSILGKESNANNDR